MRARAIVVVMAVLAVGVAGVAVAGSHTTASNRRTARADARRLLSLLVLPAGAAAVRSDPAVHGLLASPGEVAGTLALVDRHRFWRVAGSPSAVLAAIAARAPAGSHPGGQSESSGPSGDTQADSFSFAAAPNVLLSKTLVVTVAAARGGGTAVRADAQVVWVQVRSRSERVPAGVRVVSITDTRLDMKTGKSTTSAPIVVTDAAKVGRIVGLVDGLPRDQLGLVPCPADFGPNLDIKFSSVPGGPVVAEAVADGSGCGTVSFTVGGRSEPTLTDGPRLIQQLGTLLGTTF